MEFSVNGDDASLSLKIEPFQHSFKAQPVLAALYMEIMVVLEAPEDGRMLAITQNAVSSGVSDIVSNRSCLLCLCNCPIYILPCRGRQHTICEDCVQRFGTSEEGQSSGLCLTKCPLRCEFTTSPWRLKKKPETAGVRVITLDGGGIRGIIELRILKEVVAEVQHDIPIQELFDIAIGTSTGGIIALGLFKMDWKIDEARDKFISLVQRAFASRELLTVPVFKNFAQLFCSFRYKSDGINGALQTAYGSTPLFGQTEGDSDRVKVGVVASKRSPISKPYLFANYSRSPAEWDSLVRSDKPEEDLLTWQAARATSAAPIYFKEYKHEITQETYVDGALCRNNPVRVADEERRLIWPKENHRADIVLSIGTGIQANENGGPIMPKKRGLAVSVRKMLPHGLRKNVITAIDMIESVTDCQREWENFLRSNRSHIKFLKVCHRLNVGLQEEPPKLDAVSDMHDLEAEAMRYLEKGSIKYLDTSYTNARQHIKTVARRLLASLYYFDPAPGSSTSTANTASGGKANINSGLNHRNIEGFLRCRLSTQMKSQFQSLSQEEKQFRVCDDNRATWEILPPTFDNDTFSSNRLDLPVKDGASWWIEVQFPKRSEAWERISGFS